MSIYAYLRVSTNQQATSGNGLQAQLDACTKYTGNKLDGVFSDEGTSGAASLDKRPGLLDGIATLKSGDTLLIAKRDRLGRDPIVLAMIESAIARKGGFIKSVAGEGTDDDQPSNILMRRMVDAFSEYERLVIKARTKAALHSKKKRGERVGTIPFGMELAPDGIHLIPNDKEQSIIEKIRLLRKDGVSLRAIATHLNSDGNLKRNGSKWNHTNISIICKNNNLPKAA